MIVREGRQLNGFFLAIGLICREDASKLRAVALNMVKVGDGESITVRRSPASGLHSRVLHSALLFAMALATVTQQ